MSNNTHTITIKAITAQAKDAIKSVQNSVDDMISTIERNREGIESLGIMSGVAFAGLTGGIVKAVGEANKLENALMGLESIVVGTGGNFEDAKKKIQEFTADGLVGIDEASLAFKNLLARGYGQDEALAVMSRIKDAAAYGRQAGLSLGEAVVTATEGLKNENSILVDNAGITKNVAKMWEDYAKQIGKSTKDLTDAEKRQAEINGIMEETKFQIGNAEKVSKTFSGTLLRVQGGISTLFAEIGATVKPVLNDLLVTIEPIIAKITTWITNNQELAGKILLVATAITGIITVLAGLALVLGPIIAGFKLLGTIISFVIPSFTTIISVIKAVGVAISFLASPIGIIIALIVGLVAVIFFNWDLIKNFTIETFESIKNFLSETFENIKNIGGEFIYNFIEQFVILWESIKTTVVNVWNSIVGFFVGIWESIKSGVSNFGENIKNIWSNIWNGVSEIGVNILNSITGFIGNTWENIKNGVSNFGENIKNKWLNIWGKIKETGGNLLSNIGNGVKNTFTGVTDWIGGVFGIDLTGAFSNSFEKAKEATIGIVTGMVDRIKGILDNIRGFINKITFGIIGAGEEAQKVQKNVRINSSSSSGTSARASGGPVLAGSRYMVGERGPELFVPSTNGYIVPNNQISGAATININMGGVVVTGEADENRLVEKISQKLTRDAKLYKLGIA